MYTTVPAKRQSHGLPRSSRIQNRKPAAKPGNTSLPRYVRERNLGNGLMQAFNEHSLALKKNTPAQDRTGRMVQRKCACGGTCAKCAGKEEERPIQAKDGPSSGLKEGDAMQGDTEPDIEFLYANGTTTCVFPGGTPSSAVTNPNCSSVCTGEHEAKHYSDISPCCAAAGTAYRAAAAADKPGIRSQFFTWMNANRSYFECRAYAVSVACADREIAAKSCNGPPAAGDAACCTHLAAYRADKESRRVSNCAGGPALSACPFP